MSEKTTKKTSEAGGIRAEYRFDYSKSRPNRFVAEFKRGSVAIVLDPDVALVFNSSESVNTLLRSVIDALPERSKKRTESR